MSRKIRNEPVPLDTQDITDLPASEIAIILRGADEIVMQGGRALLAKILKGSKEKTLEEMQLDQSPPFGTLSDLSLKEIHARINWLIINDYLALEYDHRLPLLVFTARGWEIEKNTLAAECLKTLDDMIATADVVLELTWLNDGNREVIICLLDQIKATENRKYIPLLESWSKSAVKKVRRMIDGVIEDLLRD